MTFNELERQLAGLGKTYHSHATVHGIDNGTDVGPILVDIGEVNPPRTRLRPTVGNGPETLFDIPETATVDRSVLQEDPGGINDDDELKVKIRIHSPEVLDEFTEDVFTDQEVLLG